jgi:hypothetical protein
VLARNAQTPFDAFVFLRKLFCLKCFALAGSSLSALGIELVKRAGSYSAIVYEGVAKRLPIISNCNRRIRWHRHGPSARHAKGRFRHGEMASRRRQDMLTQRERSALAGVAGTAELRQHAGAKSEILFVVCPTVTGGSSKSR